MTALLLDLDGVLVHEMESSASEARELLRLHPELSAQLAQVGMPIFVLTHRSRAEAKQILGALEIPSELVRACFSANDLAWAALRGRQFRSVISSGLLKRLILQELAAKHGHKAADVAFVDDRKVNIDDMAGAGVGLTLHAPTGLTSDGSLISFDFTEVLERLARFARDRQAGGGMHSLTPRTLELGAWARTGISTRSAQRSIFNAGRRLGRHVRRLAGLRKPAGKAT